MVLMQLYGHYEILAVPPGHRYSITATAEGHGKQYVSLHTNTAVNNRVELEPLRRSEAKKETRPLSERVEKLKKEADSQEERAVEAVEKVKNATEEAKNKMREATHKAELATEGARKVVEKLENEAETVREDISTLLAEKTTLVGQNKALSTTKATNDEAINEQEQFIEKKTEEEAKIHDGIARADKTLQKHNKDIKTKRAELKVIETTISGVKKALVAGEKELKELVKGIATKKEEYAAQAKNLIIIADRETAVGQREVYAKKRFKEAGLTY